MEERSLITEVSRDGEGDEQGEEGEQPEQRTSISSGSHALSPGAAGLRRHCTGPSSGLAQPSIPAVNTEGQKKNPHASSVHKSYEDSQEGQCGDACVCAAAGERD